MSSYELERLAALEKLEHDDTCCDPDDLAAVVVVDLAVHSRCGLPLRPRRPARAPADRLPEPADRARPLRLHRALPRAEVDVSTPDACRCCGKPGCPSAADPVGGPMVRHNAAAYAALTASRAEQSAAVPEDRCECCDLPAYSCGRAVERQSRRARAVGYGRPARFAGRCGGCGERFDEGDAIMPGPDRGSPWQAVACCGP